MRCPNGSRKVGTTCKKKSPRKSPKKSPRCHAGYRKVNGVCKDENNLHQNKSYTYRQWFLAQPINVQNSLPRKY